MRGWLRISLRTMLAVMVLVAVYLGGRYSGGIRQGAARTPAGTWQMTFPAGFTRDAKFVEMPDGTFHLQNAGVLGGIYQLDKNRLIVVKPTDARMTNLVWQWHDGKWVLTNEPLNRPTGSSYLGAEMLRPPEKP